VKAFGARLRRSAESSVSGLVKSDPYGYFQTGQKVAALMGGMGRTFNGSYAQYTRVPATNVVALDNRAAVGGTGRDSGIVCDRVDVPAPQSGIEVGAGPIDPRRDFGAGPGRRKHRHSRWARASLPPTRNPDRFATLKTIWRT